jgi:hypothetical protein
MSALERATPEEYAPSFERYVARVPETDVLVALERQGEDVRAFLAALPADRAAHRYAPDKWTVQQVAAHVIDTERVLAYRALCVARGEAVDLPAFDENAYMEAMGPDPATLAALGEEFGLVRRANLLLFRRLDAAAWTRRGKARGFVLTPRGMAYVLVGHVRHHLAVLRERYGLASAPA